MRLVTLARCPEKKTKDEKDGDKYNRRRDNDKKSYKDKGRKSCYIAEKDSDDESRNSEEIEVIYVALKDDFDDDNATALISYVNKNDKWIIDSGCLHHMIGDRSKFSTFENYDGNNVKFGNDEPCPMKGKGSIIIIDKITSDNT